MHNHDRHYSNFTDFAQPWFQPGPPLQDWRVPAPFPMVHVPSGPSPESIPMYPDGQLVPRPGPYQDYPFVRHYFSPPFPAGSVGSPLASMGRAKDVRGSLARRPRSPAPVAPVYAPLVPSYQHVAYSEAPTRGRDASDWWDDDDDLFDLDDFEDDLDLVFGADEKKKRPFKAISRLFAREPGESKTRAEKALETVERLERQARNIGQPPVAPPAPKQVSPAVIVGATVAGVGILGGLGLLIYKLAKA